MIDKNERQRLYRKLNGNLHTKKYEKTIPGFLMRCYRNMKSRILGIQKQKAHLYEGKDLLDKEAFYSWAKSDLAFKTLWEFYRLSNFQRKLCPSVDRKDSSKGYSIDNMEWVTHSENSRRGSLSRHKKDISYS